MVKVFRELARRKHSLIPGTVPPPDLNFTYSRFAYCPSSPHAHSDYCAGLPVYTTND